MSCRRRESGIVDGFESGGEHITCGSIGVGHGIDVCKGACGFALPIGLEPEAERSWGAGVVVGEFRPVEEVWFES